MKCSIQGCPGEYEKKLVFHTLIYGNEIFIFEHVPTEVCSVCGDTLLKPDTVLRLKVFCRKQVSQKDLCFCMNMHSRRTAQSLSA